MTRFDQSAHAPATATAAAVANSVKSLASD